MDENYVNLPVLYFFSINCLFWGFVFLLKPEHFQAFLLKYKLFHPAGTVLGIGALLFGIQLCRSAVKRIRIKTVGRVYKIAVRIGTENSLRNPPYFRNTGCGEVCLKYLAEHGSPFGASFRLPKNRYPERRKNHGEEYL